MRYTQTMLAKCLRQFLLKIVSKIIKNHFENIPHQQQRISSCKIKSSQIGHITPISNRPIKIKENRLHFQKPVVNRLPARFSHFIRLCNGDENDDDNDDGRFKGNRSCVSHSTFSAPFWFGSKARKRNCIRHLPFYNRMQLLKLIEVNAAGSH